MSELQVQRVAGALGAEIRGVDLSSLTESQAAAIRQLYLEHQVIFFRDQDLTAAQFLRFAEAMGQPVEYPFVKGIEGFP